MLIVWYGPQKYCIVYKITKYGNYEVENKNSSTLGLFYAKQFRILLREANCLF